MSLNGKQVLVIGGGSGIGRAVAEGAVREGAHVTVASTNSKKVAAAAKQIGASSATLDVTDEPSVARFFASADGFDHIVFTAGDWNGFGPAALADMDLTAARRGLDVRFWARFRWSSTAPFVCRQAARSRSRAACSPCQPMKGFALTTAGAGAIEFLARGLAVDIAPVRVSCVCPGLIRTEMWDVFPEGYRDALVKMTERQLVPRPGQPAECAEAYLYLMRNSFATGQVLYVEGGSALAR